jgi:phage gpG-like protein
MHQFGSADGKVPARPYLLFQDEDVDKILTIFEKALKTKLDGGKTEEGA